MIPLRSRSFGAVLMALLGLMVVLAMFTGVLLSRSQSTLFQGAHHRDGLQALQAARAGASQLAYLLEQDPSFSDDVTVEIGRGSYSVTFDPGVSFHSVNNLDGAEPSATLNVHGQQIPPTTADVVVTGRCGLAIRRVRVLLQPGFSSARSAAALGRVRLTGNVKVAGIKGVHPPDGDGEEADPGPGGILSKFRSPDPSDPAIGWNPSGGTFDLDELSRLETAPPETGGAAVSSNLQALFPDQVLDSGAADAIPDIDVEARVAAGSGHPLPFGAIPGGSGATMHEIIPIEDARYVGGNLTVHGDLAFSEGTLYVDGNLHLVGGGLKGLGSVYVSGDVLIEGGNTTIQTGQPAGTALLAGGDIELRGLDAGGYLQQLVDDLGFFSQMATLNARLADYQSANNAEEFRGGVLFLSRNNPYASPFDPYWVNPIPAPNGSHPHGYASGAIPSLILGIKQNAPNYSTDLRAQKVVRALEEMHYHFRHSKHNAPRLFDESGGQIYEILADGQLRSVLTGDLIALSDFDTVDSTDGGLGGTLGGFRTNVWDDLEIWSDPYFYHPSMTHDRLTHTINGDLHRSRRDAYLEFQPSDFSWLSKSNFQGLVYARGDVRAEENFRVVGALIALGDLDLGDGTELIFNEEYRRLFGDRTPIGVLDYEEL